MSRSWAVALALALELMWVRSALAQPQGGQAGSAQAGSSGDSAGGASGRGANDDCMSAPRDQCADRCPSFETCTSINGNDLTIYYLVDDQRFDCAEIDCSGAARRLDDYCCQRGEFAPESAGAGDGDGGGCSLPRSVLGSERGGAASLGLGWCLFGAGLLTRRWQRRRALSKGS